MVIDFDDFYATNHRLDLLHRLRDANPKFRCTLFAVPGLGDDAFWDSVPEWCELAMHGWLHPDPREAAGWSYEEAIDTLLAAPARFVEGFKAPGWQISDGTYLALQDLGWWCADHWDNDHRRPVGLRAHVISRAAGAGNDPEHWHGHVGNVCGNGIEETFQEVFRRVSDARSFEWISEVV